MLYTINNTIKFRDEDGAIWNENFDHPEIVLTATTNRLLSLLLSRHGEVISRDSILSQVWDSYGLSSSNNSLNKYISDLRRIFKNLGLDDEVIITVPRLGFMFKEDILVEKSAFQSFSNEVVAVTDADVTDIAPQSNDKLEGKTSSKLNFPLRIFTVLIAVMFFLTLGNEIKNEPLGKQKIYSRGELNSCQVFGFNYKSVQWVKFQLSIIKNIMEAQDMICSSGGIIYSQISDSVLFGKPGRVFISICQRAHDVSEKLSSCYNFYEKSYAP